MPPQPGTMRSRWTAYAALSTTLAAGVILKSLAQRPNFYSAAVYLSQSSANLMILCNMVFVTACSLLLLLQKFLYGPLRPIEIEQLYEKAWFAVTETCLAMTIFRGEIGAWFLVMFFSLLAGKVWGWIGEGRVEVLEQQQHNILAGSGGRLFYTRLALSLGLSVLFDMTMLQYVIGQVLHMARPDMMVMFGFEFAVLTVTSLSTATRFSLNLIEVGIVRGQKNKRMEAIRKERVDAAMRDVQGQETAQSTDEGSQSAAATTDLERRRQEAATAAASVPIDETEIEVEGWEGKGRWVFYLDLMTDFCKLVIYLSFFFILLVFYGLPLHIMRDVFLTCRSFIKRIGDFMRYRTATRDMNERYPDATEAEISDNECIICREEMRPYVPPPAGAATDPLTERMRPKKLPCGHVLHFACLRSWLERQQICPTCRATVVPAAQAPQGAAAAAAAVAAAAAPGAPAQPQHPQNAGNGRPRVFQIGPLRIGIGAARGNNMFEELQEQLANLNALPPAPLPAQDAEGPQQYGFGIRWDGIRRRAQAHRTPRGNTQDLLDSAERQLQREVDSLQSSMAELQALRDIQGQLARVRMARPGVPGQSPLPTGNQNLPSLYRPPATTTVTSLTGQPQQGVLQAGSEQLPNGLTLPEGWSMMPLQPMQAQPFQAPMGLQAQAMFPHFPHVPQMPHTQQPPQTHQMPHTQQIPQVPQVPVTAQPATQVHTSQQDTEPSIANILRETRDVLRSNPSSNDSERAPADADPVAESIRLQQEIAQSEMRMAELSGQMRSIGQTIANTTADTQRRSTHPSRGQVPATHTQTNSQHPSSSQSPSSIIQSPQDRLRQASDQGSQPPSSQPRPQQPLAQQVATRASPPQRAPQMSRSTPSTNTSTNTASRPSQITALNPPRQLASSVRANNDNVTETRMRSPHRPTRSIGSSWGFTQANNDGEDDENEDEDTTDSEEDEKTKPTTTKINGSSSRPTQANDRKISSSAVSKSVNRKNPSVEDLSDDPSDGPD